MSIVTFLRNDIRTGSTFKRAEIFLPRDKTRRVYACGHDAITRYHKNESIYLDKLRFASIENYLNLTR